MTKPPELSIPTAADIWNYIQSIDASQLLAELEFPEVPEGAYARVPLFTEPFEVTAIKWPAKGKSAIHKHDGFFGAVRVLDGAIINRAYEHGEGVLREVEISEFTSGGIVEEPDGTIHLLENPLERESISLHVYYPPISTFEGMDLYEPEIGAIGTLGSGAKSASWKSEEPNHFGQILEKAFYFVPIQESDQSHYITPMVPKPDSESILSELGRYYDEQARIYDSNDLKKDWRKKYTRGVNAIVAEELKNRPVERMLALCCGTGRRASKIRELSEKSFPITGVDISPLMCEQASERGLEVVQGDISDPEFTLEHSFDAITYLYAFGHLPSRTARLNVLRSCKAHLKPGGVFFADLFCLRNIHEWGADIEAYHQKYRLSEQGYDAGDVFYKRMGGTHRAYLHYFKRDEILDLFHEAGFEQVEIRKIGYTESSGQLHDRSDEGMYWVKAQ